MSRSFHKHFHRQHRGPLGHQHWVGFSLSFCAFRPVRLHRVRLVLHRPRMQVHLVLPVFELISAFHSMKRQALVHCSVGAMIAVLGEKTVRPCLWSTCNSRTRTRDRLPSSSFAHVTSALPTSSLGSARHNGCDRRRRTEAFGPRICGGNSLESAVRTHSWRMQCS